jgi:hypothetical protein
VRLATFDINGVSLIGIEADDDPNLLIERVGRLVHRVRRRA